MPMVVVDDPAQWAISTVANDWLTRIFGIENNTKLSQKYYGQDEVTHAIEYVSKNPDAVRPHSYDASIGAGLVGSFVMFAAGMAMVATGVGAPILARTGASALLQPEKMASLMQYFDEQQDVYIQLLIHKGEPYQAGLTGSTGIVIGRMKSVGLDVLDMFSTDRAILSEDEIWTRMGLTDSDIIKWTSDMKLFRSRAMAELMTTSYLSSIWNPPKSPETYIQKPVVIEKILDGDTLIFAGTEAENERTVRFAGIDCPEVNHGADKRPLPLEKQTGYERGYAAYRYLIDELGVTEGSSVTLFIHPSYKVDKYGRTLAFVVDSQGRNLSLELLMASPPMAMIYGSTS
jgi:endonuclease YncB( thermonuclease family)